MSRSSLRKFIEPLLADFQQIETDTAAEYLKDCTKVLDAACGTGSFLEKLRDKDVIGVDLNQTSVEYCKAQGLNAIVGSILDLPFEDETFDGVHCSHVIQNFSPNEAAQLMREFGRVLKPNGLLVISTMNWFPRFFRHPEFSRPYPPDAITRYFVQQKRDSSPTHDNMPYFEQVSIWFRRQPLIEFHSFRSHKARRVCSALNRLQYRFFLRRYWSFDAYTMCLKKIS
ncbi:MAG: class I SAM-dependent methyltransferase [Fimbriimonadaceae bacterium]